MEADPSPSTTIDLALGQRRAGGDAFVRWLGEACRLRGLRCSVVDAKAVRDVVAAICERRLRVRMLLDMTACWGRNDDPYVRLAHAVKDTGGVVIDDPDVAPLADHKLVTHHALERAGLPVPPTVMFRCWAPDRGLTAEERRRLGERVVIKPARGWGGRGVILGAGTGRDAIAAARDHDRSDDFLVQRQLTWARLRGDDGRPRPAWWRLYHLFGEIIPCWWSPEDGRYRHVSPHELRMHGLLPLTRLAGEIARITRMDFFSTEICLADEPAPDGAAYQVAGRPLYVVDYVNDQCDLTLRTRRVDSPPARVIRHLAHRFGELAWRHRRGMTLDGEHSLWLRRARAGERVP